MAKIANRRLPRESDDHQNSDSDRRWEHTMITIDVLGCDNQNIPADDNGKVTQYSPQAPELVVAVCGCMLLVVFYFAIICLTVLYVEDGKDNYVNNLEEVPSFEIHSASTSNFNVTNAQINANWNVSLLAANPSRNLAFNYRFMQVYLAHKGRIFSSTMVKPFREAPGRERMLEVAFPTFSVDGWVADSIMDDKGSKQTFVINVGIWGSLSVEDKSSKGENRKQWTKTINLSCEDIKLRFWSADTASMVSQSPAECNFISSVVD